MTSLGVIALRHAPAAREARRKVRLVAERLIGDVTIAVRLATAVSEMSRHLLRAGAEPAVEVGVELDRAPRLVIDFADSRAIPGDGLLTPFFHDIRAVPGDADRRYRVRASWSLPDGARVTSADLQGLRTVMQQKSRDELMDELQATNEELQRSFEDLRRTTSAKERMESELNIGRDIQMRMLPMDFPAFPDRREFDVFATLHPAREVGGDFYDFFLIDEYRLCFVIGDVSGKGVPAALFMAMTKTLIKSRASNDRSPASILTHVNGEMAENNESAMFVTIWLGIVDLHDGRVVYANAGHNPPYVRRVDGALERLAQRHGPVVGAMEGMVYGEAAMTLRPGETIFLYTDGITEAMNPASDLYDERRLVHALGAAGTGVPAQLVRAAVDDVWRFQAEADQADDVTVLAMRFDGVPDGDARRRLKLTVAAALTEIDRVNAAVGEFAAANGLAPALRRTLNLVFDELLNNTISYGFDEGQEGQIEIEAELGPDRLVVTIRDNGHPFNPFGAATPDTTLSVDERQIGGLGVHLVRNVMDDVAYHRQTDRNVVILGKRLTEAAKDAE